MVGGKIESLLSVGELLEATDGELLNNSAAGAIFTSVQTDSRNVEKNTLFVPLIGENQDGHKYIPQGIEKGASIVFAARSAYNSDKEKIEKYTEENPSVAFIIVENTLHALQAAAEKYVSKVPGLIRVSVTGSSGKTTTKEILASVLKQKYKVVSNKGNFNSETGLPLSVFQIREGDELGLFEMGMNRENEIGEIAKVFKPQYGVVTNIGTAHIGILGSRENIAREKRKIFDYMGKDGAAFIPEKDDFAKFLAEKVSGKVIYYGENADSAVKFLSDEGVDGTRFSVDGLEIRLPLPGKYNFSNALAAVFVAKELGLSPEQIKAGIESLKPLGARSNILKGKFVILEDCYNANPDSMEKAIEFSSSVKTSGKKIFVLGDMLELGSDSKSAHEKIGELSARSNASAVFFVGKEMLYAFEKAESENPAESRLFYFEDYSDDGIKAVSEKISEIACPNDFILLKGSHGIALERLLPLLEENSEAK